MGVSGGQTGTTGRPILDRRALRASTDAVAATTCGTLGAFLTPALAPLLRGDLGITPARLGIAVAVFFAVSAVVAPLGGRLADRIGSVRVMRMALVLTALSLTGIGVAVRGWVGLVVALGFAGATSGAIQPAANRYLSRLIPPQRQGLAFGLKQAAIPAAILLGGLSVPTAAYLTGWRVVYLAGAALAVAVALTMRKPAVARPDPLDTAKPARKERAESNPLPWHALLTFTTGWGLASAGANALGAFFVLGAVHADFPVAAAGLLAVLGSLTSIGVRVGAGFLADGWRGNGFGMVAAMTGVGAAGLALLATGAGWAFVLAAVVGYGLGWGWAGLLIYAVVRTDPSQPGRTTGVGQAGAGAGACAGPLAFGALVSHAGYPAAWSVAAATLILACAVILAGRALLPDPAPPSSAALAARTSTSAPERSASKPAPVGRVPRPLRYARSAATGAGTAEARKPPGGCGSRRRERHA